MIFEMNLAAVAPRTGVLFKTNTIWKFNLPAFNNLTQRNYQMNHHVFKKKIYLEVN